MDYAGGGGGEVQQPMHHHMSGHGHPYTTPQSATAPTYQYPQHMNAHDAANLHPSHMHHAQPAYYSDASTARHSLATPSTPSQNASPRFARIASPAVQSNQHAPHTQQPQTSYTDSTNFTPEDRSLPDRDASDDTFDEAYVQFILYCNPSFSLDTDITELKRVFRNPPKSDGKSFSTFTLYELLKKLDAKELKTWTELALELGVEKPDVERGQSSQKVQQYSVRLKRWMRALHIDAFFEYLMGKQHTYFTAVPPVNDPFPDSRDGVPIEEDLAIRAIDPKFRPKRGRRRADEVDGDDALEAKRPHLDTSFQRGDEAYPMSAYPSSAVPMSAHPDFGGGGADPWANLNTPASALAPRSAISAHSQTLRWRNETPSTPHPLSAVTPMSAHPDSAWADEPQSAITPSSARSGRRRRHGPAVSSAWPSTNTTANGKLRGRPPSNRSVRDGPFVTFPANPKTKEAPVIELRQNQSQGQKVEQQDRRSTESTPTPSQGAGDSPKSGVAGPTGMSEHHFITPQLPTPVSASGHVSTIPIPAARAVLSNSNPSSAASSTSGASLTQRPERLQLQVPQHVGGPVHLITPTLLVNGQLDAQGRSASIPAPQPMHPQQQTSASTAGSTRSGASRFFGGGSGAGASTAPTTAPAVSPQFNEAFLTPDKSPQTAGRRKGSPSSTTSGTAGASNDDLKRTLTANLLRAEIKGPRRSSGSGVGKKRKLRGAERRALAEAMMARLVDSSSSPDVASWITPCEKPWKIVIKRFRIDDDGFDSPIDSDDEEDDESEEGAVDSGRESKSSRGVGRQGEDVRETFDVEWVRSVGGIEGRFAVRGLALDKSIQRSRDRGSASGNAEEAGWRDRYLKAEAELGALRAKVLDAVV